MGTIAFFLGLLFHALALWGFLHGSLLFGGTCGVVCIAMYIVTGIHIHQELRRNR